MESNENDTTPATNGIAAKLQEDTSIANRAMKFRLSRGGTAKRVRDKDAEALVKSTLGDEGQIVSRELFKDKGNLVYQYQAVGNEMYCYHIKSTLPFGDDSSRLLPNAAYFDYTSEMQGYISKLDGLRSQILASWPMLVQRDMLSRDAAMQAQGRQPSSKVEDYPTLQQMESRLYVNWYPEPVMTSGDFRFALPPDMLAKVDEQINALVADAGKELYVRMLKPVSAFIGKLNSFTGDKGQRWHDSFIDNLNGLSKELPKLNVNDDPVVTSLLQQIDAIVKPYVFQPDALKEDEFARSQVKAKLEALEAQLKGYAF